MNKDIQLNGASPMKPNQGSLARKQKFKKVINDKAHKCTLPVQLVGRWLHSLAKSKQFGGYKSVHVIGAVARFSLICQRYVVVKNC